MKRKLPVILLTLCLLPLSATATARASEEYVPDYFYSGHDFENEDWYTTALADITKLGSGEKAFAVTENAADWSGITYETLNAPGQQTIDVRGMDASSQDLSMINPDRISFSTQTVFGAVAKTFDPEAILERNKNPGLGIRALHERGITGEGVGIAIIDQALLLEHEQYKDNLMLYERIHCGDDGAKMHGPAVASIAVGKDIGVAPGSKLYYIAETHGHYSENGAYQFDASIIADCVYRVLEINRQLPANEKIRVISISKGYAPTDKGYQALNDAIKKADEQNIFVLTTSTEAFYENFSLFGMDRAYAASPDEVNSFRPASWVAEDFYTRPKNPFYTESIHFPMGSRTYAACTGPEEYEIAHDGGLSWAVPWCAGFYALCCQVDPEITPQKFIDLITSTAVSNEFTYSGKTYSLNKIVSPAAVIAALQG
ncbi:MAG: S8/S53 family peptidase [Clostridiales bacterium]|jgi:hypothetical protein|nr:S8/S53 family peptidase [Clostridiales bacterium]